MKFVVSAKDPESSARAGEITTGHGSLSTPVFMPVGTNGSVRGVQQRDLAGDAGAQIILGNTYHLYLRPGTEIIEKAGGLHRFTGWEKPMLTDSGGFQVYSFAESRKIEEEGVSFKSHIDGSSRFFSPEYAIDIQRSIGADIIMAFDECVSYPCDYTYARRSMDLTHRWLERCCSQFDATGGKYGYDQFLFPIVQGSVYKDLRVKSAEVVASYDRDGNAIGGLSVGEPAEEMYKMTEVVCGLLPEQKPRYLMGVGTPINIIECIALGIDMFDCVIPTRNGRNGTLYTRRGTMNMRNEKWKDDTSPVDPEGTSFVDQAYSKAYLRHLIVSKEMLGAQIASLHNLAFYTWLTAEARKQIINGTFRTWKEKMVSELGRRL